jgi:uncharacterized membrane protein
MVPALLQPERRLAYVDWMRGLACVLMFQTHCYSSWLTPEARKTALYAWSQLGGTLPAPLFIFLSGISFALVTEKLREKGAGRAAIAKKTILRGAEIYGLGILFRIQEYVLGYPLSPWTDLFRVDVLNILGISMMLMGVVCGLTASRSRAQLQSACGPSSTVAAAPAKETGTWRSRAVLSVLGVAASIVLVTPLVWTTSRLSWVPWPLESYLNGVHVFGRPQPWLFPIFPWVAFAFAGLAVGLFLLSDFTKRKEVSAFVVLGSAGALACVLSLLSDAAPIRLYDPAIYDYWHTSPSFFLMRCGILLMILFLTYAWCRWGFAHRGFSPMIQLGQTSLLVYWVHIEFVYGRLSILPKGRCTMVTATVGLLIIFVAMLALSIWRTRWKKRAIRVSREGPAVAATAESV